MFFNGTVLSHLLPLRDWAFETVHLMSAQPPQNLLANGYGGPTLHFGEREYVVVGFWKVGSGLGLAASMLVVALFAVLHEAVLGLRFFLEREQTLLKDSAQAQHAPPRPAMSATVPGGGAQQHLYENEPRERRRDQARREVREIFRRTFSRARMLQALLYLCQWALFVFTFVLVPCSTFNFPLILAVLIGKTAGYLLFIGSPAMESVERCAPPSPSSGGPADAQHIQLAATHKNLRSF